MIGASPGRNDLESNAPIPDRSGVESNPCFADTAHLQSKKLMKNMQAVAAGADSDIGNPTAFRQTQTVPNSRGIFIAIANA
ncbi:MAG TPA: hypothetical protein VHU23_15220 [Rhizomicrobium sp.]|nr:hypothetical protein [Rhizomicrobium sp.]